MRRRLISFLGLGLGLSDGARGERQAARFLRHLGYRIIKANLTTRIGEVDILAEAPDHKTIVIVEVKTRVIREGDDGVGNPLPEVRVNAAKQRKLTNLASYLVRRFDLRDRPIRFDVIGVDLKRKDKPVIRHHIGAFESHI